MNGLLCDAGYMTKGQTTNQQLDKPNAQEIAESLSTGQTAQASSARPK